MSGFDLVNQFQRFALGRDEVKPTASHHQIRRKSEDTVGDRIPVVVIAKEPRVDIAFAQGRLNGGEVHGQTSIVNKGKSLRESGGLGEANWSSGIDRGRPCPASRNRDALTPMRCFQSCHPIRWA